MNRGESPEIDLDRPNDGSHVSRDYPFWEIGNREFGSPGDERSGLSMAKTLKHSWVIRFKEATCRVITHFGKSRIVSSEVLVMKDWRLPW
jgi:hypothetical protein